MESLAVTLDWLMAGDPAIRWQTQRDLLGEPEAVWQAEQQRTLTEGWGSRLLACQNPDGGWGLGVYSPKWTSTTYTLLTLQNIGLPRDCAAAQRATQLMLRQMLGERRDAEFEKRLAACDRCVVGMLLLLAVTFGCDAPRISAMVENLLAERMPDGAWNCRRNRTPRPQHSSFHSTINILEGLHAAVELNGESAWAAAARAAEQNALEVLLQHRLFRSDTTGEIIREEFTQLAYPYRWHYNMLRALAFFAQAGAPRDPRLQEAIDLLRARRGPDGRWRNQRKFSGRSFFELEKSREPSRWLTLQALRVLRWWENANHGGTEDTEKKENGYYSVPHPRPLPLKGEGSRFYAIFGRHAAQKWQKRFSPALEVGGRGVGEQLQKMIGPQGRDYLGLFPHPHRHLAQFPAPEPGRPPQSKAAGKVITPAVASPAANC